MNIEYAAGLIDGEGWIGISRTTVDTYTIRVAVAMVTKGTPILSKMHRTFGGHVSEMKPQSDRNAAKTRWTVDGVEAALFLEEVYPHLILKTDQAMTALRMWEEVEASRTARGRRHWTPELRERCEVAKRRIHDLNSRGPQTEPDLPDLRPVAVYQWGAWWEPDDDLFGPVEFQGSLPTSGRMVAGRVYAMPSWNERQESRPQLPRLLPTPEQSDGSGGRVSSEMGGTRPSGAKRAVTLSTAVAHRLT